MLNKLQDEPAESYLMYVEHKHEKRTLRNVAGLLTDDADIFSSPDMHGDPVLKQSDVTSGLGRPAVYCL